jgi:hypothetical protein
MHRPILLLAGLAAATAGCTTVTGPTAVPASSTPSTPAASAAPAAPTAADPKSRFVIGVEGSRTVVDAIDQASRQVRREVWLDGRFVLPDVLPGGPPEGLSRDGRTLVLQEAPADGRTRFAVLDAALSGTPRIIGLRGWFSYDAMSPHGSVLYLIQQLAPAGSDHYAVRALDVGPARLWDGAIVDKRTPGEAMTGRPLSRATDPDGTVVATLYLRESGGPFVHLLNVVDGFALCADLPRGPVSGWTLSYIDGRLLVLDRTGAGRFAVQPDDAQVDRLG